MGFNSCREGAGPKDSLSACVRHVEVGPNGWPLFMTDGFFGKRTDRFFGQTDFYTNGFLDKRLKKKIFNGLSKKSSYGLFWASF